MKIGVFWRMLDVVRVLMICSTCGDVSLETETFTVTMGDGRYVDASFSECGCGYVMRAKYRFVAGGFVSFTDCTFEQLDSRDVGFD